MSTTKKLLFSSLIVCTLTQLSAVHHFASADWSSTILTDLPPKYPPLSYQDLLEYIQKIITAQIIGIFNDKDTKNYKLPQHFFYTKKNLYCENNCNEQFLTAIFPYVRIDKEEFIPLRSFDRQEKPQKLLWYTPLFVHGFIESVRSPYGFDYKLIVPKHYKLTELHMHRGVDVAIGRLEMPFLLKFSRSYSVGYYLFKVVQRKKSKTISLLLMDYITSQSIRLAVVSPCDSRLILFLNKGIYVRTPEPPAKIFWQFDESRDISFNYL